jgi:hypothetical protein
VLTVTWLIILGILIGGGVIPHVEDTPRIIEEEPETAPAAPPRPPPLPPTAIDTIDPPEEPQTLSWAPYPRATSYRVEFRDELGGIVYQTIATGSTLQIPHWPVGTHRWLVWPIVDGYRRSQAIVNSLLNPLDSQP